MHMLIPLLLVVALVLFIFAAANVTSRINLMAAGLAFWVLAVLVQMVPIH